MFDLSSQCQTLGLGDQGISSYYSPGFTEEDCKFIQGFLDAQGISAYNTRVFKGIDNRKRKRGEGEESVLPEFTIVQAAVTLGTTGKMFKHEGKSIKVIAI